MAPWRPAVAHRWLLAAAVGLSALGFASALPGMSVTAPAPFDEGNGGPDTTTTHFVVTLDAASVGALCEAE
jgi:hypothetical protein